MTLINHLARFALRGPLGSFSDSLLLAPASILRVVF